MELKAKLDLETIDDILVDAFEDPHGSFRFLHVYHTATYDINSLWHLPKAEPHDYVIDNYLWAFLVEEKETGAEHILSEEIFKDGFQLYVDWKIEQDEPVIYPGCPEWDCVEADIVLQFALLGEIVYG